MIPAGYQKVRVWSGPFAGAQMLLTAGHSKRKRLGIYEHELNPWLRRALPAAEVVWDIGATDGYFTYGSAHAMLRHRGRGAVIAFEPGLAQNDVLRIPSSWPAYRGVEFHFDSRAVGSGNGMETLDRAAAAHPRFAGVPALVRVDVEGAELDVLTAASHLLAPPHQWIVEVHGRELRQPVRDIFDEANRATDIIESQPHWLFGPEQRILPICWVVTRLDG